MLSYVYHPVVWFFFFLIFLFIYVAAQVLVAITRNLRSLLRHVEIFSFSTQILSCSLRDLLPLTRELNRGPLPWECEPPGKVVWSLLIVQ